MALKSCVKFLGIFLFIGLALSRQSWAEEVKVTTYYPSPAGDYNELRTSGNTYLATNSGSVGIGTLNPTNAVVDINTRVGGAAGLRVGAGSGIGTVRLASGSNVYPGYIDWTNASGARLAYLGYDSGTNLNWTLQNGAGLQILGGNTTLGGDLAVSGVARANGGLKIEKRADDNVTEEGRIWLR
jgi:hypothetical protein